MDDIQGILQAMMRVAVDPTTAAVAIAVIGLNIHFGYTGLLNIGQSAFMLLGAYGFAISITQGWPLLIAILVGLLIAFVFALVLGVPTLKLRGDYLAIVTISAAEIVRYVGRSVGYERLFNLTGGAQGIPGSDYRDPFTNLSFFGNGNTTLLPFNYLDVTESPILRIAGWAIVVGLIWTAVRIGRGKMGMDGIARSVVLSVLGLVTVLLVFFLTPVNQRNTGVNGWWFTVVAWLIVAIGLLLVLGLTRSPWGRALKGVREDEDAMRSLGKNVFAIKMQALVIGGLFGAIGGMMYVLPGSVQPDALGRNITFFCYTALLLGGAATIWGPVLGSLIFFVGRIGIIAIANTYLSSDKYLNIMNGQQTAQFAFIVVGVSLMLLVIFRPQGILGDKRELRFNV
ncbi:MAG TPA: branched-chain amino acid ABC transporter permease [Nocardioides sp.]|uniref:branched-chain amino acid ABC transporter permease n=1 Tax=uncultured Nocardioides sp. TaxID=198441 RepID=UPI000EC6D5B8|nr:branched-chain amino acid ABC transporter permease [uncultured Nocardioides sp.]HCB07421.1 branched-chain amino acid ABC transporter permease [Nocardioides sp.]HRD60252.1 branched-chain amino acid ABC transporter permease [Nocardioides sp.]HRI94350.1 branched-chain amino acid ABC transporter permease [Nocardioides sp.]HRK44545.1 branched-chain amino acid ABC transporter permease [Nocardioides sp.]